MSNNFRAFEFGIRIAGGFTTDPVTGKLGEFYVNTTSNLPKFYNGTLWLDIIKNEYLDTEFRILDDGDITKKIAFEAANISTATTRTIIMPDNDVDLGNMVSGPVSSTDNAIARFDGVTGKLLKDSGVLIDNSNNASGFNSVDVSGSDGLTALLSTKTGPTGIAAKFSITDNSNIANVLELSTANSTGNHLTTPDSNTLATEDLRIRSGKQTGTGGGAGSSGTIYIGSGDSSEANSGGTNLFTGTAVFAAGQSGVIQIYSGDADDQTGSLQLRTGISISGNSGGVSIQTGTGVDTGTINFGTGNSVTGTTGNINSFTGNGTGTGAFSGSILIGTGTTVDSNSGQFAVSTGTVSATGGASGLMSFVTGDSFDLSGGITLQTGNASVGDTGGISIVTGNADGTAGDLNLFTGTGNTGSGGNVYITAGDSTSGAGGEIGFTAGSSTSGSGGPIYFTAGSGIVGGDLILNAGDGSSTTGGNIQILAGTGATTNGMITLISDKINRRSIAVAGIVEESYIHSIMLTGSTTAVATELSFNHGTYSSVEITYQIFDSTGLFTRLGTLRVIASNALVGYTDTFAENGDAGVTWTAAYNGANIELSYTTTAGNKTMRADIKRFLV